MDAFLMKLYQWAGSLTSNGRNMPLALPLRIDKSANGFVVCWANKPTPSGSGSVGKIACLDILQVPAFAPSKRIRYRSPVTCCECGV